nr:hypothetical protein [Tanacetum cinerariifolium]
EAVVNISYSTTNKAFQVLEDPSGHESPFNSMYKFLAHGHILMSLKPRVHIQIEPINLVLINSINSSRKHTSMKMIMMTFVKAADSSLQSHWDTSNVSGKVESLMIKPPIRDIIRGTYVIGVDIIDPHLLSDMTWWITERQRSANINPDLMTFWISPINLICKHLVTLFHLELEMDDVWVESFKDFVSLAFKISLTARSFVESEAPEAFFYCLLLSKSTGLDDEDRGGGGSCEDPEAPKAPGEGGVGGGDPEGVLGESGLFRHFLRASARSA